MTRGNNTAASLTPGVTCDIGCHGHQMIVTGNQSSQENPNSCGMCVFVLFVYWPRFSMSAVLGDDGIIIWNPRSISIQSAVCHNLAKIARVMYGGAPEDSRAPSHNCVKHFLVAIHKTSDRI